MRSAFRAVQGAWCSAAALLVIGPIIALEGSARGDGPSGAVAPRIETFKIEHFDEVPNWDGHNNRLLPKSMPTVRQDFGFSATRFAGRSTGEVGGKVVRCSAPCYYAARVAGKSLNDKLSASGTFALKGASGSSGVFFGWFNSRQEDGSGRPRQCLGMDFDGEPSGARLALRAINVNNRACGTFVTPFLSGRFRPTPIALDGTRYFWTLDYDPDANGGHGRIRFTIKDHGASRGPLAGARLPAELPEAHRKEALSHFPNKTDFAVDLPAGFKEEGAVFDRFGLLNTMKPGGPMTIYFGDLRHDGVVEDFKSGPDWLGSRNRAEVAAAPLGSHDFGYSANTNEAGGERGEVGGDLWRGGKYAYYADRVGPLTLDDRLEASGKVVLKVGAPDSGMSIGWFSGAQRDGPPAELGNFVGAHVGGPTRVGHYFLPQLTTAKGTKDQAEQGPVLTPGKVFNWSLVYDPDANAGQGEMRATLDDEAVSFRLKPGRKSEGARLDHFGLFTSTTGGQLARIFFDDLKYTSRRDRPGPALRTLSGHGGSVLAVAYSPDGKLLASASRDGTVKLWDARTGTARQTFTDHVGDVYDVVFSPDGKILASGGQDKVIRLRDPRTGEVVGALKGHGDIVRTLVFSPDGRSLVSGSVDRTVRIWDVRSGRCERTLKGHTARVMVVACSPDGKLLASASSDQTVRLWDARTGRETAVMRGHASGVEAVAFSPDGQSLASSGQDGAVRLWDVGTRTMRLVLKGHVGEVDSVTFAPGGRILASGCKDRTIRLWGARTGRPRKMLLGHTGRVESLAFSPDGRALASGGGGGDTSILLWDMGLVGP